MPALFFVSDGGKDWFTDERPSSGLLLSDHVRDVFSKIRLKEFSIGIDGEKVFINCPSTFVTVSYSPITMNVVEDCLDYFAMVINLNGGTARWFVSRNDLSDHLALLLP